MRKLSFIAWSMSEYNQLDQLRYLAAKAYSHTRSIGLSEAVNHILHTLVRPIVTNRLAHRPLCRLVWRAAEVVLHVNLEIPAFTSVLPIVALKMDLEPVACKIGPLSCLACTIVVDKVPGYLLVQIVVAQRTLKNPVAKPSARNHPAFRLVNDELGVG